MINGKDDPIDCDRVGYCFGARKRDHQVAADFVSTDTFFPCTEVKLFLDVLMTGVYGRCGTAAIDHLHGDDAYDFTYLNRSDRPEDHPYGEFDTVVADVTDAPALNDAAEGQGGIVHMAAYPYTDGEWHDVFEPNIVGMYNALEAAQTQEVESSVFLSTNHVMGMYETEHSPELYSPEYGLVLDHADPVRPDSFYGTRVS